MVSTSAILSDCLFSVAMMVSKDLSMTSISGVEDALGGADGDGCGGDGGRHQLVHVLTMIDHVSWKQHHIISF